MLKTILSNPKRLFVCVAILVAFGIYSGFKLPVSLFPATSKPVIRMWVPFGTYSAATFRDQFGDTIEKRIQKISNSEIKVDDVKAFYEDRGAYFEIDFAWGTSFDQGKKEVDQVAASISSSLPKEIADNVWVWQRNRNAGFFAASLYSDEMSLIELYDLVEPILGPELAKVKEADRINVWNPERFAINIHILPDKIAQYGIYPNLIKREIRNALASYAGSSVDLGANAQKFEIKAEVSEIKDIELLTLNIGKQTIYLKDIAEIDYGRDMQRDRSFKTNGLSSLILFANPKSGANVKKMSEEVLNILERKKDQLPKSLKFKIIVDPSEIIQNSVSNLLKDIFIAAFMAVLVLYLFIGGIKNVATAAIEIPLSMILSFILMNYFEMNINLITLGGLALAAGMNVDASVVIMENIFKHRQLLAKQGKACDSFLERLNLVYMAVKEVALPVILSITTTLIVFIPMAFTSNLTNAILGDLARAVIFSHAISGLVALVIVPSVRVLILKNYDENTSAVMDKPFTHFQAFYEKLLIKVLNFKYSKVLMITLPLVLVTILTSTLLPELPKEVIGKPSSDWVYTHVTATDTKSGRHMENVMQEVETKALKLLAGMVDYTWFERYNATNGQIMYKLLDRKDMDDAIKILRDNFKNTGSRFYGTDSWNPAELPLPREHHFKANIKGSEEAIFKAASLLRSELYEKQFYDRVRTEPSIENNYSYVFTPYSERWKQLKKAGVPLHLSDIAEISKLTHNPTELGSLSFKNRSTEIKLTMRDKRYAAPEDLEAYPIKIGKKIIPLSSLGQFESVKKPKELMVKNRKPEIQLTAKIDNEEKKKNWETYYLEAKASLAQKIAKIQEKTKATVEVVYPQEELQSSLTQLKTSLAISIALIFFVLWMQFQSVKQVVVIMMTVPLGISGVIIALWATGSYLSLNSALGIILLNGITVNNSILLTEVTNTLRSKGLRNTDLIISATKKRLRPIFITSLTTILGMLPVALGLGDGGKILQPLGIAVSCGLFIATISTIFVVPTLLYRKEEELRDQEEIIPNAKIHINKEQGSIHI